jgi:hypothetical protein
MNTLSSFRDYRNLFDVLSALRRQKVWLAAVNDDGA